jgi:hypothetical protein
MLDWDNLITATEGEMDDAGQTEDKFRPAKAGARPVNPQGRPTLEANNGGASERFRPARPVRPAEKQVEGRKDGEKEGKKSAPGGGVAAENFAPRKATSRQQSASFQPDPEAVVMVLEVCRVTGGDIHDLATALEGLRTMSPDEQVRRWHSTCVDLNIKPWRLLHPKAPEGGLDCMGCSHISSTLEFIPDMGRRCFTWLCGLGYSMHVHDHAGERVLIAPPECQSWERWYMG